MGQEGGRCVFCGAEAVGFGLVQPPMCQRHYEVARMACLMERGPAGVTVPGLKRMLAVVVAAAPAGAVVVREDEVAGLLWDLLGSRGRMV